MAVNLELKIPIKNISKFEESLVKIGAELKGVLNQKDIYYKVDNGLLKLRLENGEASLIKYSRDEKNKNRWSNYFVLKLEGEEVENYFNDFFQIETVVSKKRKLYIYKDTRIHLDLVEGLGEFLELETVVIEGKEKAKQLFDEIVKLLEINTSNQIKTSYRYLVQPE